MQLKALDARRPKAVASPSTRGEAMPPRYDNLKQKGKLAPKRRPEDFGPGDGPK